MVGDRKACTWLDVYIVQGVSLRGSLSDVVSYTVLEERGRIGRDSEVLQWTDDC